MEDITPGLLKMIRGEFQEQFDKNEKIASMYARIRDGTATYAEANDFAIETGEILANSYASNISSKILPDGRMYYNIASRVIDPTMKNNYDLIVDVTEQVQKSLNEAAGIGIKPVTPELNQSRIQGIINRVSDADNFDDVAWILEETIVNFSQSIVDDSIKANAEFQAKSGLQPVIIRKVAGNCCEWCKALAGKYRYPDEVPQDVYRRHQRCRCTVDYNPGSGKIQNVHSKQWRNDIERDKITARKIIGLENSPELIPNKGKNVTKEYERGKYPGQGRFSQDDGYIVEDHREEERIAKWLHKHFGGDIRLLCESDIDGTKMPDYLWRGKYWELKTTSTEKAANSAIRKGIKQIEKNPGGIILNYDTDVNLQEALEVIEKRMKGSKQGDIPVDIMIISKNKLMAVLRY